MKPKVIPVRAVVVLTFFLTFAPSVALCAESAGQVAASPRQEAIAGAAEALRPKLIEMRRDFHMHPELSNREERTSRVVAERLRALGLDEVKTGVAGHGLVA